MNRAISNSILFILGFWLTPTYKDNFFAQIYQGDRRKHQRIEAVHSLQGFGDGFIGNDKLANEGNDKHHQGMQNKHAREDELF